MFGRAEPIIRQRARGGLLLALLLCAPAACAHAPTCAVGGAPWWRTELFMGLVRKDGAEVSAEAFTEFVDRVVTPLLPSGFTVLSRTGQYTDAQGKLAREPSHVLIVLHHGDPAAEQALVQVRNEYKKVFEQESVLRTDTPACASF